MKSQKDIRLTTIHVQRNTAPGLDDEIQINCTPSSANYFGKTKYMCVYDGERWNPVLMTKPDAVELIRVLREEFDIPDLAEQLQLLIERKEEQMAEHMSAYTQTVIANVLQAAGVPKVSLNVSSVLIGQAPQLVVDAAQPDLIHYSIADGGRIRPMWPKRDDKGHWIHPQYEAPSVCQIDGTWAEWHNRNGLDYRVIEMPAEYDEILDNGVYKDYCTTGRYSRWNPDAPHGEGWILVAIYESENDGPAAIWIRYKDGK